MNNSRFVDVHVSPVVALDYEHRKLFDKPWLAQWPSGKIRACATEEEACKIQREWRAAHGRDPITGKRGLDRGGVLRGGALMRGAVFFGCFVAVMVWLLGLGVLRLIGFG